MLLNLTYCFISDIFSVAFVRFRSTNTWLNVLDCVGLNHFLQNLNQASTFRVMLKFIEIFLFCLLVLRSSELTAVSLLKATNLSLFLKCLCIEIFDDFSLINMKGR